MKKIVFFLMVSSLFLSPVYTSENEKAYMVIEIKILDNELYTRYTEEVYPVVVKYGGRYLARGGKISTISGGWEPERIVIIEFPCEEALRKCFSSPEYKAIAALREESTQGRAVAVRGTGNNQ